MVSNVIN